jgi:hypothetical protein
MFDSNTARLAGSKSKRGLSERTKVLNELFNKNKAMQVFQKLEEQALDGSIKAIELYLAYCFGKPESKMDITSDGERIGDSELGKLSTSQLYQLKEIKESI